MVSLIPYTLRDIHLSKILQSKTQYNLDTMIKIYSMLTLGIPLKDKVLFVFTWFK